eukprot:403348240
MDCVQECPHQSISSQLSDDRFRNGIFKYCRQPIFYVDSNSYQNIELGTKQYPFRMLDDAFRESFNNFPGNPSYTGTTRVPYENEPTNQSHSTVTIYDHGYKRNNTVFNPTLYSNSTFIPYNYQKQIDQGLMTVGEATELKYKFLVYDSGIQMSNISFIELYTDEMDPLNALFRGNFLPYKWAILTNCIFHLSQVLMHSIGGFNVKFEHNYFDISEMQNLVFSTASSNCNVVLSPGMANRQIWSNNYFTGHNQLASHPMIVYNWAQNITFTNNIFNDLYWEYNQKGLIFANAQETDCPPQQKLSFFVHIENNTINNKHPSISNAVAFNIAFTTLYPNIKWDQTKFFKHRNKLIKDLKVFQSYSKKYKIFDLQFWKQQGHLYLVILKYITQ